jgi:hypothetical protein
MSKRYELLQLTNLLGEDVKIQLLASYVSKLTLNIDLSKYFGTCEMTLFIYNCILNAELKLSSDNELNYVIRLYNAIYPNIELTTMHINKITSDIKYIKENKMFNKISHVYYYLHLAYTFFFCPNIYVIEQ